MTTTTREEAIAQLQARLKEPGKFSITKLANIALGITQDNKAGLQALLNKLLQEKGVLSPEDEKAVSDLVNKQSVERKIRAKIIVRNVAVGVLGAAGIVGVYYVFKHNPKMPKK